MNMPPDRPTSGRTAFVAVALLFASAILFGLVPAFFHAASTHPNVMMITPQPLHESAVMADLVGYAASCAVVMTSLMRTMLPLRLIAIISNVLLLVFG